MSMNDVLDGLEATGALTEFAARLPIGEHDIAVRFFRMTNTRGKGRKIETEFTVLKSTASGIEGAARGDSWFIDQQEHPGMEPGHYAKLRMDAFVAAVARSLGQSPDDATPARDANGNVELKRDGTPRTVGDIVKRAVLADLLSPTNPGRGVVLHVSSTQPSKNGNPVVRRDGSPAVNNSYNGIPQTLENIKAVREHLDKTAPMKASQPAAPQHVQPQYQAPAPAPAPQPAPFPATPQASPPATPPPAAAGLAGLIPGHGK